MDKLKVAVVGTGYLGRIHAKLYKEIENCSLEAVCDIDETRLNSLSQELGVKGVRDYKELFGKVDAVSIAVPTKLHFQVSSAFLENNIHTLVEKPFTENLRQADALIKLAQKNGLTLQVGHIERFNSAFSATQKIITEPKFIECHRLSPFPNRSIDIGVVLDLMIHDIDIVIGLVGSGIKRIEAVGVPVLTRFEDIANARITFRNGCVANLTASRVSEEAMRKIRIFQKDTYISLDYREAKASVYKKSAFSITKEDLPIEKEQPLKKELESFVTCVIKRQEPLVSGPIAREALSVALTIQKHIWNKKNIF
ncbi:MAG: Gfo/Idh/MocA family oxidoreductase [Candidatus Omnitrophica bacterium]|nr:Gfo/Idh/MocA family oxidoreductase [Candidatus Omnitrophota bacterium]